jgi:pyrroloquinoline quinone biosynthesis protein D
VGGGSVLLFPEGVLLLTPTAAAVLALCDGRRTVDGLAAELAGRYLAAPREVYHDTVGFLARLLERGLVEVGPEERTGS